MLSKINAQHHFRLIEELCRLKHEYLALILNANRKRLVTGTLPSKGGIYAFWWTGNYSLLDSATTKKSITLKGPAGRLVGISISSFWSEPIGEYPIPLYVGKSADNLKSRISKHLRLGDERLVFDVADGKRRKGPTTTCQLRFGIDNLFPKKPDTRDLLLKNVGLSYVELDGDKYATDRFFIEDLAIGLMKPIFNIDIER